MEKQSSKKKAQHWLIGSGSNSLKSKQVMDLITKINDKNGLGNSGGNHAILPPHLVRKKADGGQRKENEFMDEVLGLILDSEKRPTKTQIEKIAAKYGITDKTEAKELTELAIVEEARRRASGAWDAREAMNEILQLYAIQPNLSQRDSISMMLQQYSTPAPIAYLLGCYVGLQDLAKTGGKALEPSAGNGMLTIASPRRDIFTVNEVDTFRRGNLARFDYKSVTGFDASKPIGDWSKAFDAVITNPPFSKLIKREQTSYGPFKIKDLDHLMAIHALSYMQDNGKAAVIVGGHTTYDEKDHVQMGKNRMFLGYLYHHYNVEDVINVDGDLYSRMGTKFDIRLILVNGRNAVLGGLPPKKSESSETVNSYEALTDRVLGLIPSEPPVPLRPKDSGRYPKESIAIALQLEMEMLALEMEMEADKAKAKAKAKAARARLLLLEKDN